MLTGSLASTVHGTPRATQDIDVVISPDRAGLERLLEQFPEQQYYVSREAALDAYERTELFNVIDSETGWKMDFLIRKNRFRAAARRYFSSRKRRSRLSRRAEEKC